MERYDKYKDSGIEWIGEIPEHWETVSLKWISSIYSGGTPSKDKTEYWHNGTIPWLNSGTVNQFFITEPSEYITEAGFRNSSTKWIPENSIVIALAGQGKTKGMAAKVLFKATCNQSLGVININRKIESNYLLYWLIKNYQNIRNLGGGDQRDGINLEMIGGIKIPLPKQKEQTAIAIYLDRKTKEIDELIADKKRLLELYEEEKTAIINQSVTKGINPNAPMKDSGIEWLGEIPEHWETIKLKRVSEKITDGEHISPKFTNEGIPFLSAKDVRDGYVEVPDDKFVSEADSLKFRKRCNPEFEDVLMVSRGATVGRVAFVNIKEPFCLLGSVILIKPNEKVNSPYLFYSLKNHLLQENFLMSSQSSAQQAIYLVSIAEVFIAFPPKTEQEEIVKNIELHLETVNSKKAKTEKLINLLTEYRTALISEVVTGKIKVTKN